VPFRAVERLEDPGKSLDKARRFPATLSDASDLKLSAGLRFLIPLNSAFFKRR